MFPQRFFSGRQFTPRYFPQVGGGLATEAAWTDVEIVVSAVGREILVSAVGREIVVPGRSE